MSLPMYMCTGACPGLHRLIMKAPDDSLREFYVPKSLESLGRSLLLPFPGPPIAKYP